MKVGIDLGTTNSALAYIDEREAEDRDFPPVHIFETPQLVAPGTRRAAPHAAFVPVSRRRPAGRRLRARAGRAGAHAPGALGQVLALESGCRSHREDPAVGFAGDRPRALAGGGLGAHSSRKFREEWDRAQGAPLAEQDIVLTVPASFDEEARELTVMAARDAGLEQADAARRAGRGVLFLDREQPGAVAQEAVRRPDRAGLRRGRRHQRLQPDPRLARRRPASTSPAPRWASTCCWAATIWI